MIQRSPVRRALITAILLACASVRLPAQGFDYVTEEEEDLIRDAQTLEMRVHLYIQLLDNRIVELGLRERTEKEREQAKKDLENYEREAKSVAKIPNAELRAKPLKPDVYLRNTSRTELLRGYQQIIDETMDYIDDAHDRKLEVRDSIESLEKFLSEQLPRFGKLEPKTTSEASVIKSTITHSEQAVQDCRDALKTLPKTVKTPQKK